MYKSKLQELCFEKSWALPQYSAIKTGPDHIPEFRASVFVDGKFFHSPSSCGSLKEAHNQAAMSAFTHFSSPDSTPASVSTRGKNLGSSESSGKPQEEMDNSELTVDFSMVSIEELKQVGKLTMEEVACDVQDDALASMNKDKIMKINKLRIPESECFLLCNKV